MLTVPAPPRPDRSARLRPEAVPARPGGIERRQRRTAATLAFALVTLVAVALVRGSEALGLVALAVGVVSFGYLLAVVHVRRVTARREMSAAFATDPVAGWEAFERGFSDLALTDEVGAGELIRTSGRGFDRELVLFVGAWFLGLVLTPVIAVIRLAGLDLSDPGRRGLLGALVRAQAYGRSQSMKVVAAGLFATAGVTAVGAVAVGGTAYAAPIHATSAGEHLDSGSDWTGPWAVPDVAREWASAAHRATRPHHVQAKATKATRALDVALAQVGKPYVYGAAGPDAFDCSGLVMFSWAAAGVSLPHNAAEQYDVTTHISESELRPGDLVFYYGFPPGHVAMYIGNGRVVSANTSGTNVQTQSITWDGTPTGFSRVD